jgi:hypothetical protein
MSDVVFEEQPVRAISPRKSDGVLVVFLVNVRVAKTPMAARVMLVAFGLLSLVFGILLFIRTANDKGINPNRIIPPAERVHLPQ